ncbi:hypothetical protein LCGC14_2073350 [marine sediment metagenome]|uniref:Alpha/beta hydrolase n=1 Tax=marine sediment metagenome TaxID=412755 RepID=A0A0F9EHL0_9ZZZZ
MKKINLITIHGIRSKGDVLEKTAYDTLVVLPDDSYSHGIVTPIDYPRVLALMHHIPWVRKVIEWGIARRLHEIALMYPGYENIVMAHSNGSRALSRVLETTHNYQGINSPLDFRIKKILLFGSIIPRGYDWARFSDIKVTNFVGTKDKAVLFSRGWSGRFGFKNQASNVEQIKFRGGHSDYATMMTEEITMEVINA